MNCQIMKNGMKCRFYDICRSPDKDVNAENCKVRFDYAFQSRRNLIFGRTFHQIKNAQDGK